MTCTWYEQQLANDAVDLWPAGHPAPALLEHARTCGSCDRLVQQELELRLQLIDLSKRNRALQPSPSVRRSLIEELDSLQPSPTSRRTPILSGAIVALAIICLALAVVVLRRPHRFTRSLAQASAVKPPTPIATEPSTKLATSAPTVLTRHQPPMHKRLPSAPTVSDADFYPVVMCDSITCAGPALTVRVQLPRSPLATRGSDAPVMADLLVGEDGTVRGVRLLQ